MIGLCSEKLIEVCCHLLLGNLHILEYSLLYTEVPIRHVVQVCERQGFDHIKAANMLPIFSFPFGHSAEFP